MLDVILDQPCAIHSASSDKPPTRRLRVCWIVRQVAKGGVELLDNLGVLTNRGIIPNHDEQLSEDEEALMIYETHSSRNQGKELFERSATLTM